MGPGFCVGIFYGSYKSPSVRLGLTRNIDRGSLDLKQFPIYEPPDCRFRVDIGRA